MATRRPKNKMTVKKMTKIPMLLVSSKTKEILRDKGDIMRHIMKGIELIF